MFKNEEITEAGKHFGKKGGKQIMGVSEIRHSGEKRNYKYLLEDGSEVREDEDGAKIPKMPEISEKLKAKRAAKNVKKA